MANSKPYPLIHLGDDLPANRATIEIEESAETLGRIFPGMLTDEVLSSTKRFYGRDGKIYSIANFQPPEKFTFIERLKNILSPFSICRQVDFYLEECGETPIPEFRERILALIAADPGDMILQFREEEEWTAGLENTKEFPALFDFVIEGISPSEDPYSG